MTKTFLTAVPGLTLRFATEADVSRILEMIRELAEFEHLGHEVTADEPTLRKALFQGRPVAEAILAEWDGETAGYALFFSTFSTFLARPGLYLEDLYIRPGHRGRRIGEAVLVFLAQLARERDCGRLEWSVLDWNEPAMRFYRRLDAQAQPGWTGFRLTGTALERLATGTITGEPSQ